MDGDEPIKTTGGESVDIPKSEFEELNCVEGEVVMLEEVSDEI